MSNCYGADDDLSHNYSLSSLLVMYHVRPVIPIPTAVPRQTPMMKVMVTKLSIN